MKRKLNLFMSFIIISLFTAALDQKNAGDFSGTWLLNIQNSNFGKLTPQEGSATEIKIILGKDSIKTERKFASLQSIEVFNTNGNLMVREMPNQTKKTAKFNWIKNEKQFMISSVYEVANNGDPYEYTRTETYTLSDDGKSMTLDRITVIPDRTDVVKAVYDRK